MSRLGSGISGATALAAALGSLPVESSESPVACGIGTGGYSSRYAMAVGCAVRMGSSLSLNAGGSYLFGGPTDYGNGVLSSVAGRIGLVYRFGAGAGGRSTAMATSEQANRQLRQQLQEAEQRQEQMATDLRDLQKRLAQLESVALLR
ncbi:MAG: YadA-like family protein [Cyanobacteriota bacterium]|nr:YadA-like family protein [Cyanobacteriota bacterium]